MTRKVNGEDSLGIQYSRSAIIDNTFDQSGVPTDTPITLQIKSNQKPAFQALLIFSIDLMVKRELP